MRNLTGALVVAVGLLGLQAAPASAQDVDAAAVRTLYYNASGAAEFKAAVDKGAQVWNTNVVNVKLVARTTSPNITIVADNGWPRAQPTSLGNGRVWMGRQATAEGHDPVRIAAHELGHILGLPDRKPGPCTSLMSGSSAGTSCKNPVPNAAEKAEVERNFRNGVAATKVWNLEFVG
jgi:snapalysin